MAHPRTEILDLFRTRLQGLPSQPSLFEYVAKAIDADSLPAVALDLGDEELEGAVHAVSVALPVVRRFRVRVVCSATSRSEADELASEVELAAPYDAGLGVTLVGSNFAADGDGDRPVYSVRVNFDALYEATIGSE